MARLDKSERRPVPGATLLGPADPNENLRVSIYLRRRADAPPLPDHAHWMATPHPRRSFVSRQDFAAKYGAAQHDLDAVTAFAAGHGLTVVETNAARRLVKVSGTVAQMNAAFGVGLQRYQNGKETYRGLDGFVHVPDALDGVVLAVLGLDNRRMAQRAGAPAGAAPLNPDQVAQLYDFPAIPAGAASIGILEFSGGPFPTVGYFPSDVTQFFMGQSLAAPTVTAVPVDGGTNTPSGFDNGDDEVILDICVAGSVAPGAKIAVYFTPWWGEMDWVDAVTTAVHDTTNAPTVLSISWDSPELNSNGTLAWTQATMEQLSTVFQEATALGMTIFVASGDYGSDCTVGDGNAHVYYPASDPWVVSCGGTTITNVSGSSFDEGTWNDDFATGGGISDVFDLPAWQQGFGIPASVNAGGRVGRGIPDVAGNASPYSGYTLIYGGMPTNPTTAGTFAQCGTSAVAPLYAGLVALINANLATPVGYLNPTLYALGNPASSLGGGIFRDINDGVNNQWTGGAADAAHSYTSGPGWDACTGLGVVDGSALFAALQALYQRSITVITQKSTFGQDESQENGGLFPAAILAYVDGLKATEFPGPAGGITTLSPSASLLAQWAPALSVTSVMGTNIQFTPTAVSSDDPSLGPEVQRFTFTYQAVVPQTAFTMASVTYPEMLTITASLPGVTTNPPTPGSAQIELITAADPFFFNEANGGLSWLSEDLRAFYVEEGATKFGLQLGSPQAPDPLSFIQQVISNMSGPNGSVPGSSDTFENLPHAANQDSELSLLPTTLLGGTPVYNFALARVRLTGVTEAAQKVRVFFRTWQAQTTAITFTTPGSGAGPSPATGPFRQYSDGISEGRKVPLLGISGDDSEYISVPFFATSRVGPGTDMTTQPEDGPYNAKSIAPPTGGGTTYAYFGAWLDTNQGTQQFPLQPPAANPDGESGSFSGLTLGTVSQLYRGLHQCLVAEIVDDDAPILNNANPANSDKIAQRNIAFVPVANPGIVDSRLATHTFEIRRPSATLGPNSLPDELMIDWGRVPKGRVASIYLPAVAAVDVRALAARMYTIHDLTVTDAHTLQCPAGGITYIPIPPGSGANYVGLFSIELPFGITKGQQFEVVVRQLTSARARVTPPQPVPQIFASVGAAATAAAPAELTWRRVVGSFQISIPVSTKDEMLVPAERALSIMKWVGETIPHANRWYPVFQRYLTQLGGRVAGLGGNPSKVPPTWTGTWPGLGGSGHPGHPGHPGGGPGGAHDGLRGKIAGLLYDGFGDFEGFILETYEGEERRIESREPAVEDLAKRAWAERIRVHVFVHGHHGHRLKTLVLLHPS